MEPQATLPLFTVIIPVKDRGEYLRHTLKTCMIQDYPNLEIIVSDDGSTDNTSGIVEQAMRIDSRVQYFSHNPGLGMRDNFEFALNQVRPGYVIALGGDDGLTPGSIQKMYKILTETSTELLTWPSSQYIFPGYNDEKSKLIINHTKGIRIIKSKEYLKKVSVSFYYFGDKFDCPMFYIKGVASTKLVDRVKSRTKDNYFYSCPTPDGYSGIVLAGEVVEYAFTGEPLSIGGNSTASQGRAYMHKDEQSKKAAEVFFNYSSVTRPMHRDLALQPYSPLITLMTADYLLTAKDLPGWPGQYPPIDYENLIRKCFVEISERYFARELIIRELKIIKIIAEQHGIIELFNYLLSSSKRKVRTRLSFEGSVITPRSIIIDSKTLEINNIYDAAHATKYIYNLYRGTSIKQVFRMSARIADNFLHSKKYKLESFPTIEELNIT